MIDWPRLFSDYSAIAGGVYEFCDASAVFKDSFTTNVSSPGDEITAFLDKSGLGHHSIVGNPANRAQYYVDAQGVGSARFFSSRPSYYDLTGLNCDAVTAWQAVLYTSASSGRVLDTRGTGAAGSTKGWALSAGDGGGSALFVVDDGAGHFVMDDARTFLANNMYVAISWYVKGDGNIYSKAVTQGGERALYLGSNAIRSNVLGDITSTAQCRMGCPSNTTATNKLDAYVVACGSIGAVLNASDRDRVATYLRDIAVSI